MTYVIGEKSIKANNQSFYLKMYEPNDGATAVLVDSVATSSLLWVISMIEGSFDEHEASILANRLFVSIEEQIAATGCVPSELISLDLHHGSLSLEGIKQLRDLLYSWEVSKVPLGSLVSYNNMSKLRVNDVYDDEVYGGVARLIAEDMHDQYSTYNQDNEIITDSRPVEKSLTGFRGFIDGENPIGDGMASPVLQLDGRGGVRVIGYCDVSISSLETAVATVV